MIDPMANLDAVPGEPGSAGDNAADEKDVIDFTTLRYNMQHIDQVRSVMGIASGCVAGICGLTGYEGLGTKKRRGWKSS
jgi:EMC6